MKRRILSLVLAVLMTAALCACGGGKSQNAKPAEISLTVVLNALTGCDVRKEALAFVSEAKAGKQDYFYVGNAKLVTAKLMLTDATISDVEITNGGKWVNAKVQLTMKQSTKDNGSTSGSSGSSGSGGGGGGGGSKYLYQLHRRLQDNISYCF